MRMFEELKKKFWSRYTDSLMELERRRMKKEARSKKKMESLQAGTIGYGLAMKQSPSEVYHSVLERRRHEREQRENSK